MALSHHFYRSTVRGSALPECRRYRYAMHSGQTGSYAITSEGPGMAMSVPPIGLDLTAWNDGADQCRRWRLALGVVAWSRGATGSYLSWNNSRIYPPQRAVCRLASRTFLVPGFIGVSFGDAAVSLCDAVSGMLQVVPTAIWISVRVLRYRSLCKIVLPSTRAGPESPF